MFFLLLASTRTNGEIRRGTIYGPVRGEMGLCVLSIPNLCSGALLLILYPGHTRQRQEDEKFLTKNR